MELYHGTIREYAKHILKEGLRPHPENAFHVNRIPVQTGRVYLAKTLYNAQVFAKIRAQYTKMEPGESQYDEMFDFGPMYKNEFGQPARNDVDTTPTVILFDVPQNGKWGQDSDSLSPADETCKCTIPPERVKGVFELRGDKWIATRRLA